MSGGKGGSSTSTVTIPEYIEAAAQRNLNKAERISQIGYTPYYGPDVAAFTPMQQAAFQNTADTAGAFGMSAPTSQQDIMGGMAAPTTYANGVQGYSSAPMFEQSLDELGRQRPGQKSYIDSFFIDPFTGGAGSNNFAPIDYTQYGTLADQLRDTATQSGGEDTYSPPVFTPPPIDVPFTPGPVNQGLPTTLNDGNVYTSTDFAGAEVPYTIVTPTDVRPPGYVDNTPSTFPEVRQYYDSSPMTEGGPAIMYSSDGTETNLGFDLGPSVQGGRGTIVPGQTTTQIGIPGNFSPDPLNVGDLLISVHGFTPEEAIASGYEPSFVSNPGTVNSTAPAALTPAQIAYTAGSLDPFGGSGDTVSASPGYTGIVDRFDGGGPSNSGDTYSGGGVVSDIGNSVTSSVDLPGNVISRALNIGAGKKDDSGNYAGSSDDGTVMCTAYCEMGYLPNEIWKLDRRYGVKMYRNDPTLIEGYHMWGVPVANYLRKQTFGAKVMRAVMWPIVKSWAEEMAHNMKPEKYKPNYVGKLIKFIGEPFSRMCGKLKSRKIEEMV